MATRSRTSTPVQYEDFLPKYEWKEETGSHILVLYLPQEFKKEQIRITYVQSTRMIRVNGERPVVNNKWSRFNQGFPVPQNCDVNKIEARYQNGVLTLTMPKTKPDTTAPQPPIATVQDQKPTQQVTPPPPPPPPSKETDSTLTPRKQADEKTSAAATATAQKPASEQPKPQKGVETSSTADGFKDQTAKKSQDGTAEKAAPPRDTPKLKDDTSFPQEDESSKKRKEKAVADEESSKKRKESTTEVKRDHGLKKENNGEDKAIEEYIAEKVKLVKGLANAAKRNIQEFSMEVNEDRQAMVNVGVAVLVIVALGTYIYYSRGSSRSAK